MLSGEKILVTGPAGQIAFPLARYLARDNEVWGIARFGAPGSRELVDAAGVTTRVCDLGGGGLDGVPDDFTYVVHLAAFQEGGLDYDEAIRVNAEGTGMLLEHCRRAKAALVMSTHSVYRPHADPLHVFTESDPLGDASPAHSATYSISKIAQEAVARTSARVVGLPVTIARMNASYGPHGGLLALHLDAAREGRQVVTRWDPCPYQPIYQDDINIQLCALLLAARVPATIVNWAGDEAVSVQEWCAEMAVLTGRPTEVVVQERDQTLRGSIADVSRRLAIAGPCQVGWRDGLRRTWEQRYSDTGS